MKKRYTLGMSVLLCIFSLFSYASHISIEATGENNEYVIEENNAEHPCITTQQYELLEKRCADNIKLFGLESFAKRTMTVTLGWPLRATANLSDCSSSDCWA